MQNILKFKPIYKDKIWGGRKLETILGREILDGNIGESWEVSDYSQQWGEAEKVDGYKYYIELARKYGSSETNSV